LKVPLIVLHGSQDVAFASIRQMKAVAELAIACNWAPEGLISHYYEHSGGHCACHECPEEFHALYRKAFEEQVLRRTNEE